MAARKKRVIEKKRIAAGIIHRGNASDTLACLDSLLTAGFDPAWIMVADLSEHGGLEDFILQRNDRIQTLGREICGVNYAAAANALVNILADAGAAATLVINGNFVVAANLLEKLSPLLTHYPDAAAIGPGVYYLGERNVDPTAYSVNARRGVFAERVVIERNERGWGGVLVDAIDEKIALITSAAFEKVGEFDEEFGEQFVMADFCLRAKKSGFTILSAPEARAFITGTGRQNGVDRRAYFRIKNGLRTVWRHSGKSPVNSLVRALNFARREATDLISDGEDPSAVAEGLADAFKDFLESRQNRTATARRSPHKYRRSHQRNKKTA